MAAVPGTTQNWKTIFTYRIWRIGEITYQVDLPSESCS